MKFAQPPKRSISSKQGPGRKNRMKQVIWLLLALAATTAFAQRTQSTTSPVFPDIATSKAPLTAEGKFTLFALSSVSPARFSGASLSAAFGQSIDAPEGYGQGTEGYAKRFGASMATGASNNFFGKFLIPSLLHHDPRFFAQGDGSLHQSLKYAVRRVVITRTDSGNDVFNWSGILAPLAAQSIANSYLPEEERTVGKTFRRSGMTVGTTVAINLLKEYWPTISKKLRRNNTQ